MMRLLFIFFFFNDTATTEIYTLSLHDALPISQPTPHCIQRLVAGEDAVVQPVTELFLQAAEVGHAVVVVAMRSEEHTSELQSQSNLVCRLLLEKKKKKTNTHDISNICTHNNIH